MKQTKKEFIKNLIAKMTIREKLGQMTQLNGMFFCQTDAELTGPNEQIGIHMEDLSIIGSTLNLSTAEEMKEVQSKHMENDPNHIPMLVMKDVIHGYRTIFPIPLAMGASFDPDLMEDCSRMAAKEASASGVHVTFTPMVDYVRDARWGRVMETAGEDVLLNSRMGAAQVRGFHGDGYQHQGNLATCIKHFAGYGGAEAGRDYNTVEISERLLREYYLPAYKACLDAGAPMVMPSFNSLNGVPSVANSFLMNQILRKEWGFDGVVISDYAAIKELKTHGVAKDNREAALKAIKCGCDIEMMSVNYLYEIEKLVEDGIVSQTEIDASVEKILSLKWDCGLFEDPYHGASPEKEAECQLTKENRALAEIAAEKCAVLLKNDGILPFSKQVKKIALIGPFADNQAIIGNWHALGNESEVISLATGIKNLLPDADITVIEGCSAEWNQQNKTGISVAVEAAKAADIVILCVGELQSYSGEGNSRTDLKLPGVQEKLCKAVCEVNPNTAVLLFNGRPLVLNELHRCAPAILEMWFPGTEGGNAAAKLLFGDANPCGVLSMSFPKAVGQCPIYYNHPSTGRPKISDENTFRRCRSNYIDCGNLPLYPFGHGLSYSSFRYESMELDSHELTPDGKIKVTVKVSNQSDRDGEKVVQLFFHDLVASTVRPIQSLLDFKKVMIPSGKTVTVEFFITEPQLRFYDLDCSYHSEAGDFDLFVGYADHPDLKDSFRLVSQLL